MRVKKNREVNIFSASVVDLFASGLGVFLIVAIIALVNQKKENQRIGQPEKVNEANERLIEDLEQKLKAKEEALANLMLKNQGLQQRLSQSTTKTEGKQKDVEQLSFEESVALNQVKNELNEIITKQKMQIKNLLDTDTEKTAKIKELDQTIESLKEIYKSSGEKSESHLDPSKFEVGTKIQLNNVQFYAGTEKAIEPYASREIQELARVLLENKKIKVEVSGHIFLSKEELEKGSVYDDSNLSGRRARVVCQKLVELGVAEDRLKCIGYGGRRYLHLTNDQYSEEAQLNRRVEVEILAK